MLAIRGGNNRILFEVNPVEPRIYLNPEPSEVLANHSFKADDFIREFSFHLRGRAMYRTSTGLRWRERLQAIRKVKSVRL